MSDYDNIFLSKHHNIVCQNIMCDKCLMAAVYLEYMAAVFLEMISKRQFFLSSVKMVRRQFLQLDEAAELTFTPRVEGLGGSGK